MDSSILTRHYGKILEDNREKILSGGTGDSFLRNAKEDSRMALVVLIRISPEITRKIGECIGELKEIEPELYYYGSITKLVGFRVPDIVPPAHVK